MQELIWGIVHSMHTAYHVFIERDIVFFYNFEAAAERESKTTTAESVSTNRQAATLREANVAIQGSRPRSR